MRRRVGTALVLLGLTMMAAGGFNTRTSDARQVTAATFADIFNDKSYSGNSGSASWSGSWWESGEADGPTKGQIEVKNDNKCAAEFCIEIQDDKDSRLSIAREADLDGFATATLTFAFRRDSKGGDQTGFFQVQARTAGGSWVTLKSYPFTSDDETPQTASFSLTEFISKSTAVRFSTPRAEDDDSKVYIDNVQIKVEGSTVTTTTTQPPTTTTRPPDTSTTTRPPDTTTTTIKAPEPTTTTRPRDTTTTSATVPGTDSTADPAPTTTTTTIPPIAPTSTPDFATDKVVLVSSSGVATEAVMQPLDAMSSYNEPESTPMISFVNAAESLRSTSVYGAGIGILLAGFLLVGFDDRAPRSVGKNHRRS